MNTTRLRWLAAAATVFAMTMMTACTPEAAPTPTAAPTTHAPRPTVEIKVGTLLPMTGTQSAQGESTLTAIRLAANDINEAELGVRVEIVVADSGSAGHDIALDGALELIAQGVTAVIGPRASAKVLQSYEAFAAANVVQISPAATLPGLSDIDSGGFFFRTAPSDIVQASTLARRILFDGAASVDIIAMSDAYSIALSEEAIAVLRAAGAQVVLHRLAAEESPVSVAAEVAAASRDAILIVSGTGDFRAIVDALAAQEINWSKVYGTDATIEVLRDDLEAPQIEGALFSTAGVLANRDLQRGMLAINPDVRVFAYAPEAYDALVVIALAALQAQSAEGAKVREHIADVSGPDGEIADTFEQAARIINSRRSVDYSGLSGPIDFAENGDLTGAFISFYLYGKNNTVRWLDQKFWQLR